MSTFLLKDISDYYCSEPEKKRSTKDLTKKKNDPVHRQLMTIRKMRSAKSGKVSLQENFAYEKVSYRFTKLPGSPNINCI